MAKEEIFYLSFHWDEPEIEWVDKNYWAAVPDRVGVLNPNYANIEFLADITQAARFTHDHMISVILDDITKEHHDQDNYRAVSENEYILYRMGVK